MADRRNVSVHDQTGGDQQTAPHPVAVLDINDVGFSPNIDHSKKPNPKPKKGEIVPDRQDAGGELVDDKQNIFSADF